MEDDCEFAPDFSDELVEALRVEAKGSISLRGLGVWGLGVWDLGVWGLAFRVSGLGFGVWFRVWGSIKAL